MELTGEALEREVDAVQRFVRYARIDTTSSDTSTTAPSTARQFDLAAVLVAELRALGLADAAVDPRTCVVRATLPAAGGVPSDARGIALLAHLDTSPDAPGAGVRPLVHTVQSPAQDVVLADGVRITAADVADCAAGARIITSDGTTLLGADDKAGIAIIMGALCRILQQQQKQKQTPRPAVHVLFTPDEEVGRGTEGVDVDELRRSVSCAYTVDGDKVGALETETWTAHKAVLSVTGVGVHPGYAFGRMANAAQIAADFAARLPASQRPETTRDRDGFIHLHAIEGSVERATATFIVREFDDARLEALLQTLRDTALAVQAENPRAKVELATSLQYSNMRKFLDQAPEVVDAAVAAYRAAGVEPVLRSIRGGTDGSRLSALGVPCPNIFAGGMLFHSRSEFLPIESLLKGVDVVEALIFEHGRRLLA